MGVSPQSEPPPPGLRRPRRPRRVDGPVAREGVEVGVTRTLFGSQISRLTRQAPAVDNAGWNAQVVTLALLKPAAIWLSAWVLAVGIWSDQALAADGLERSQLTALTVVNVREPDGQILSYRHLAAPTEVHMRGTRLAPDARVKLKIGSRPGFVELDINRGGITGLTPAHKFGKDFLTYVLWAVSVDGRASNLGEITFDGDNAVAVNVTTPYQTFWLMATAEPNFAVIDPSSRVVLYSVKQGSTDQARAIPISGDLFFFTHYSTYESSPGRVMTGVPNQLQQARKAMELASRSAKMVPVNPAAGSNDEQYAREALNQSRTFLNRAEQAFKIDPTGQDVIQFARTAAQSAENARGLVTGAVGGVVARQLQNELVTVRAELAEIKATAAAATAADGDEDAGTAGPDRSASMPAAEAAGQTMATQSAISGIVKQPAVWFAAAGWLLAIVLLFRRRSL